MAVDHASILALLKRNHMFRGIDVARLDSLVNYLKVLEVKAGDIVFYQGDDADNFYFVFSGRLKASRYFRQTHLTNQTGFLDEGDYFGQEVLSENWPRQITVEAVTDTVLLVLDVPNFKKILDFLPNLSPRLQLILDSYRLLVQSNFEWLEPEEFVYYVARRHPYKLVLRLLPPLLLSLIGIPVLMLLALNSPLGMTMLVLLILVVVILLGWIIWEWVDWLNDYYLVTSRRVVYQEKIVMLYDSRQESPIGTVQSTATSSTYIGRILGFGNVAIRTFTGILFFGDIAMPDFVMGLIQEQQLRAQSGQRLAEQRKIEGLIERRIGVAPPSPEPSPPAPVAKMSSMLKFVSEMFHLRYEEGGAIIYRTHWFVLVTKIWIQSILLLGLAVLLIFRLLNFFTTLSIPATLGVGIVVGTVIGGWWFYRYMDWHNDLYIITADQVIDVYKKPLGNEQRDAAPIKNILSIEYKRLGIIGLILNYGTVAIRVGERTLTFNNVYNPSAVQRELFDKLSAKQYQEKQAAQESERQRLAEWMAAYHRVVQRNQPPPPNTPARGGF